VFAARRKLLNFSYMSRTVWKVHSRILYTKLCLFVSMYVCMYVCMELIQIRISEPI
jgi:hypothetical protein